MKRQIATTALRGAKRHPQAALGVGAYAVRHRRGITQVLRASRRTAQHVTTATDPVVQNEVRDAIFGLGQALQRARSIGITNAVSDRKVAKHLDAALGHASTALSEVHGREKPSHKPWRFLLGAGLVAGAFAAWSSARR